MKFLLCIESRESGVGGGGGGGGGEETAICVPLGKSCISRLNFEDGIVCFSLECRKKLDFCFCFSMLCGWFSNISPLSSPVKSRTKTFATFA